MPRPWRPTRRCGTSCGAPRVRATGRCWSDWPQESGIETPTAEDLARLDRKRKGKKLSNQDWVSKSDPEAKIARMKDGTTHLAYKPEHAVDLDTGAVVAAELHPTDEGDTTTLAKTPGGGPRRGSRPWRRGRRTRRPAECVTDKGYHSRGGLEGPG